MRRRVLVSAYAVSPSRGSEPGMGWNICTRLARHHDVTVLCSPCVPPQAQDFRDEIARFLRSHGPIDGLRFHFVEPPIASYLFQRETPLARRTLYYFGYRSWQRAAMREAQALHSESPFEVVHQLNITSFREPGYLWQLPGVPFVWGPLGGAANVPLSFFTLMSGSEQLFYAIRNVANFVQQRTLRRPRRAARRARHIWVIGDANHAMVTGWGCAAERLLEVGGEPLPHGRPRTHDGAGPLHLVWSGQHVGRKALPLLLYAIASLREPPRIVLTVLGEGRETPAWRALATRLNLNVIWAGALSHPDALAEMSRADAFVSTSILEETSTVVLEALALGLPVICHDACGMRVAVTPDCGIKIPMLTPNTSIAGFADAVRMLSAGGSPYARLSQHALLRARELDWDHKAESIAAVYSRVAGTPSTSSNQGSEYDPRSLDAEAVI